jgi:RNA polymerase sigma-70 factor (ECF subfamily)
MWRCSCPPDDCAAWVRRYRDGDREAGDELARKFDPLVLSIARRVLGPVGPEDLDDARQAIFLRAFDKLDRWDGLCPFCNWLAVVAARRAIDHARAANQAPVPLPSDLPDPRPGPSPPGVAECIERTIAQFPPERRRVFEMAAEGIPRDEIAATVRKSVRTIHYWLVEIRDRLQKCLDT